MIRFSKHASTERFKKREAFAKTILLNWQRVFFKSSPGGYEIRGIFKDPERPIYIEMYITRKSKGIGAGRYNRIAFKYSFEHHPELNSKPLTAQDLKIYGV